MSPTRIPNESFDETAAFADEESARNVPDAELRARRAERYAEAELERIIEASALRLERLAQAQVSIEEEAEIA